MMYSCLQRFVFIVLILSSCQSTGRDEAGVEAALNRYDGLLLKMDAGAIALTYAPDGAMGKVAHGRDSIRRYLATFTDVRVLSQSSTSQHITLLGDSAVQEGRYEQIVLFQEKDTIRVNNNFMIIWVWIPNEGWRIKKFETI